MKKLFCFFSAIVILFACQRKQFFISSPEIDVVIQAQVHYLKGDWESFKSVFDTNARIWINAPRLKNTRITRDQLIDTMKASLSDYSEYKIGANPDYEDPGYGMIVDDEGGKWVHTWITWLGKHRSGKEIIIPVFTVSHFKENKIDIQFVYYNALPGYLANQEDSW